MVDHGERSPAELAAAIESAPVSQRSLERRRVRGAGAVTDVHDLPVNAAYIGRLRETGCVLKRTSKYLNAASVVATPEQINEIKRLPFVRKVAPVRTYYRRHEDVRFEQSASGSDAGRGGPSRAPASLDYGPSYDQMNQINVIPLHDAGINGEGVMIGVLDTGFKLRHEAFQHLDVEAQYDFIFNDDNPENEPGDSGSQHNHGTQTLSVMAGYAPGKLIGPAYAATFVLAKTERVFEEVQAEEDDFVRALEWADSIGVDIVSSSLGYYNWYSFSDLDGNTAVTTIACDIAVSKGITVCSAAGNERNSSWGHIIAPSDGDSVIACGAVDASGAVAYFSSPGPSYDGRIKPDVSALGLWTWCAVPSDSLGYLQAIGTSFSTPLIAGACGLILQMHPAWGPMKVLEELREHASNAPTPDNDLGWGIIDTYMSALDTATGIVESVSLEVGLFGTTVVGSIFNNGSVGRTFQIERQRGRTGGGWEPVKVVSDGTVVPAGSSNEFEDRLKASGAYQYRLRFTDDPLLVTPWSNSVELVFNVTLDQSRPNPFVAGTHAEAVIPYSVGGIPPDPNPGTEPPISSYSDIRMEIYDVSGARVRTLVEGIDSPGDYTVGWNGRDDHNNPVASGIYFYRLRAAGQVLTRKLVFIRR
jgi:hypothetical protein